MLSTPVAQESFSPSRALSPTRRASQGVTTNKNVEWLSAPGAWTFIVALIALGWLILSLFMDSGLAWTYVHLLHGVITYYLLHWNKGSPVQMDQVCAAITSLGLAVYSIITKWRRGIFVRKQDCSGASSESLVRGLKS